MKKIKIKINNLDKSVIMQALVEKRNNPIKENRAVEPVNELIIKYINKEANRKISFCIAKNRKRRKMKRQEAINYLNNLQKGMFCTVN